MKTDDLIAKLGADNSRRSWSPAATLLIAVAVSAIVAGSMLMLTIGVRPDIGAALTTWRFDFKFVVTLTVVASAYSLLHRALFPRSGTHFPLWLLLAGPTLLLAGIGVELIGMPEAGWAMAAIGKNAVFCLTVIPALGIVPLGLLVWALRQGAPTRPTLGGFCAGILAGGIAATFYAANCTDDSPLFVATWYPIGVVVLGAVGAVLGRYAARW
ncbi:MAG: DUF1109 family protein [Devosia nanyangense]|uniref:DUF1109 family protein n=1 Tax=Devosia nanyangense TaxID=1228055 RepID=A0A933L013_9HYPH|nr:DUF1109 family protein [Devosia nanyangense]